MTHRVEISDELYEQAAAFAPVVAAVLDEELVLPAYLELLLRSGIDSMLDDLLRWGGFDALLSFVQQLAASHPSEVYGFVARTLQLGAHEQTRTELRHRLGFHRRVDVGHLGPEAASQARPGAGR